MLIHFDPVVFVNCNTRSCILPVTKPLGQDVLHCIFNSWYVFRYEKPLLFIFNRINLKMFILYYKCIQIVRTPPQVPQHLPLVAHQIYIIAGVAVGCLSLSLLLTAASVVITFLCTRRCYNKKSSPPSPTEKSVYYETVQSDSVQMQPSPAYQSVEQLK